MRIRTRALVVSALLPSAFAVSQVADAADGDAVDVSCAWRKLVRRNTSNGATLTPRMRGTVDVAFQGSPVPRLVSVALYASKDGVSLAGAPLATKFVHPREGRKVRVSFDAVVPFGDAGRFLVARADDAEEVVETDETNNVAASGPFVNGEEYYPLETGTRWRYGGSTKEGRKHPVEYVNSVVVAGEHVLGGGVVTQAVASSNDGDSGAPDVEYMRVDDKGVVDWGSDSEDELTAQIGPTPVGYFPLTATYDVAPISLHGLHVEDLDGDGRVERVNVSERIRFLGFEDVDLPVARFTHCARLHETLSITVVTSRSGATFRLLETNDDWLAPGIGNVRGVRNSTSFNKRTITKETLTGFLSPSGGFGVVDGFSFAAETRVDVAPASLASDGTIALMSTARAAADGNPHGLVGIVVSSTGVALREFQIADVPVDSSAFPTPAAAYGAGEFVVAYRRTGEPLHLRAVTADGAFPWGAATVDIPVATGAQGAFRVAFDGTDFLVMTEGDGFPAGDFAVSLARVSAAGSLLDSRVLSGASAQSGVAVAWDGSSALCVWSMGQHLLGVRVGASGDVLDATPIRIGTDPGAWSHPSVAASPTGGWFLTGGYVPSDGRSRIRGSLVSADGVAAHPDGVEFPSTSDVDKNAEVALDGAEFLVAWEATGPYSIRAARVSLAGDLVPTSAGGVGVPLAVTHSAQTYAATSVVCVGDRALVAWRGTSALTGLPTGVAGAIVFPRREDLRRAAKSAR